MNHIQKTPWRHNRDGQSGTVVADLSVGTVRILQRGRRLYYPSHAGVVISLAGGLGDVSRYAIEAVAADDNDTRALVTGWALDRFQPSLLLVRLPSEGNFASFAEPGGWDRDDGEELKLAYESIRRARKERRLEFIDHDETKWTSYLDDARKIATGYAKPAVRRYEASLSPHIQIHTPKLIRVTRLSDEFGSLAEYRPNPEF